MISYTHQSVNIQQFNNNDNDIKSISLSVMLDLSVQKVGHLLNKDHFANIYESFCRHLYIIPADFCFFRIGLEKVKMGIRF